MTEIPAKNADHAEGDASSLDATQEAFVAAWGQMAGAWGISRTMAEVHALLYISGRSMNTDEIMERLQISRGNASMSIRALLDWGIISKTHRRGDRKEYFEADQDVWSVFRSIVRERMKREVEPLLAALFEIRDDCPPPDSAKGHAQTEILDTKRRLDGMLEFLGTVERLSHRFAGPSGKGLETAAKLLGKLP
ncbi:MAG: MarR family transcriptional regulator [Planctomycetota bacterium]